METERANHYKVIYCDPTNESNLQRWLQEYYDAGWKLVTTCGNYFIFELIPCGN